MKRTLEQILASEKAKRIEWGIFGIKACKEAIEWEIDWRIDKDRKLTRNKILFELLYEYFERARRDKFFNTGMILACWEMINE